MVDREAFDNYPDFIYKKNYLIPMDSSAYYRELRFLLDTYQLEA